MKRLQVGTKHITLTAKQPGRLEASNLFGILSSNTFERTGRLSISLLVGISVLRMYLRS